MAVACFMSSHLEEKNIVTITLLSRK